MLKLYKSYHQYNRVLLIQGREMSRDLVDLDLKGVWIFCVSTCLFLFVVAFHEQILMKTVKLQFVSELKYAVLFQLFLDS